MNRLNVAIEKDNIGIVEITEDVDTQKIYDAGVGIIYCRVNEISVFILNGLNEEKFFNLMEELNIQNYIYKNWSNLNELKQTMKTHFSKLNEEQTNIYIRKYSGRYNAIRRMKGLHEEWEQI